MTSIMHPGTYARVNAVQAKASLQDAAAVLRRDSHPPVDPFDPNRFPVTIPEQNGPATPDNPWYVKPTLPGEGGTGFASPAQEATLLANAGISRITTALGVQGDLSAGVVSALGRARDEALAGVRYLADNDGAPVDRSHVPLMFDASTMWLDLAVNLIDLDMKGGRPPVTIQPVPGPGEPGSPITILPLPEVEAPEATTPVEVEAPEAMAR